MAFNFNWSPLTADAGFYERARDLLTTALNKSPKPPIIVDDIFVTEFNLGSVPPDLEILEIGDLAEDRFRGIFKMCYSGDAFLTLKTRVQVGGNFSLILELQSGRHRDGGLPRPSVAVTRHLEVQDLNSTTAFPIPCYQRSSSFISGNCHCSGILHSIFLLPGSSYFRHRFSETREGAARGLGALSQKIISKFPGQGFAFLAPPLLHPMHTLGSYEKNIMANISTIGKPLEYLPVSQTGFHVTAAISGGI